MLSQILVFPVPVHSVTAVVKAFGTKLLIFLTQMILLLVLFFAVAALCCFIWPLQLAGLVSLPGQFHRKEPVSCC